MIRAVNHFTGKLPSKARTNEIKDIGYKSYCRCLLLGGYWKMKKRQLILPYRVKAWYFGHQVNSDTHLQTVEIQMRRLLMSRLIRIFTVSLVDYFFIRLIIIRIKQGSCPNLPDVRSYPIGHSCLWNISSFSYIFLWLNCTEKALGVQFSLDWL